MSQTPSKAAQKMCKSPKNSMNFHSSIKHDKIDYETLSTNCTVVGSNNLNLVKKPQIVTAAGVSPAYSNANSSPVYPASPYSSPASLKSPSPSLKPPTPQPQTFPVMQIIHNNHHLLARPIQQHHQPQQQNIIKLKPHLNILPKPSGSPQPSPKASVSPQIMIPANAHHQQATLMQSAQPLLLNQMPMLTTTPGVQFILKPQAATKVPTATATPQGLILQQGGQPIIQLQPPRSQPMVRVLTNSVQIAPGSTTPTAYVQMSNIPSPNLPGHSPQQAQSQIKKKPKAKVKKKLDLANIMKLSGIGDEDDIQFESDTSQSENEHNPGSTTPQPPQIQLQASTIQAQNIIHQDAKKISGIQIQGIAQPTLNAAATPVVQVLNQNFQSGMISNSTSQASGQAGIPFSPFLTPNFTINNGLMVQRSSGGFKLAVEDGRFVLQHDPNLSQDLQSQLILQSIFGLNGGLVLQPSLDQQTVQQTVQTIQQQSVQTIQQQTVQSQTIQTVQQQTVQPQTVQHSIQTIQPQIQQQTVQQTIQHQTVQSQPIATIHQQPMQIVQPQPIHGMSSQTAHSLQSQLQGQIQSLLQHQQNHVSQSIQAVQPSPQQQQQQQQQQSPAQNIQQSSLQQTTHQNHTQPVLKVQPFQKSQLPVQTVHPQPIQPVQAVHPQPVHSAQLPIQTLQQQQNAHNLDGNNHHQQPQHQPTSYVVNLTPDQLEQLKRNGQLTVNGQTIFMPRSNHHLNKQHQTPIEPEKKLSPKIHKANKKPPATVHKIQPVSNLTTTDNSELPVKPIAAIQQQPKDIKPNVQHKNSSVQKQQPSAMVQPQPMVQKLPPDRVKTPVSKIVANNESSNGNHDVDKLLGQILEESGGGGNAIPPTTNQNLQHQRIHTIQLTPQKQQHLKNIQAQIQNLSGQLASAQGSANVDIQNALKGLFAEQQKILATGKLLPPDKVYYHNNQLTIVNPSSLNSPPPTSRVTQEKSEPVAVSPVVQQHQQQQHQGNNNARRNADSSSGFQTSTAQNLPNARILPNPVHTSENVTQTIQQSCHHQQQQQQSQQQHQQLLHATHQQQQQNCSQHTNQSSHNMVVQHHHHLIASQPAISPKVATSTTTMPPPTQLSPQQQYNLIAKKAHLIEAQLTQDQTAVVKPDIWTPFRDKRDACIRLVRYHCMDQPVLSQKDLNKADEIFEMTARHFITKYEKMVDKYKFLLMKESQKQVRTSELMMLDRMFFNDELQSLTRLRQEAEFADLNAIHLQEQAATSVGQSSRPVPYTTSQNNTHIVQDQQHHFGPQYANAHHQIEPNEQQNQVQNSAFDPSADHHHHQAPSSHNNSGQSGMQQHQGEEYDEWACIQRELGCMQHNDDNQKSSGFLEPTAHEQSSSSNNSHLPTKRSASSDSRLETLKRFRVEKHHKKVSDSVHINSVNSVVQSVSNSLSQNTHVNSGRYHQNSYDGHSTQHTYNSLETEEGIEGKSIDEQVQSAIDSILNLQQNTALDLDSILS